MLQVEAAFRSSQSVAEVLLIHIDSIFKEICLPTGHGPKFDILCSLLQGKLIFIGFLDFIFKY